MSYLMLESINEDLLVRQNIPEGKENLTACISLEFCFLTIVSVAQIELTVY